MISSRKKAEAIMLRGEGQKSLQEKVTAKEGVEEIFKEMTEMIEMKEMTEEIFKEMTETIESIESIETPQEEEGSEDRTTLIMTKRWVLKLIITRDSGLFSRILKTNLHVRL
jgi:hypothetical protein